MGFNRNIIIQADINRLMNPGQSNPQTLTANPPSGFVPATAPAGRTSRSVRPSARRLARRRAQAEVAPGRRRWAA